MDDGVVRPIIRPDGDSVAVALDLIRSRVDAGQVGEALREFFDILSPQQPLDVFVVGLCLLASALEADGRSDDLLDGETARLLRACIPDLLERMPRGAAPVLH